MILVEIGLSSCGRLIGIGTCGALVGTLTHCASFNPAVGPFHKLQRAGSIRSTISSSIGCYQCNHCQILHMDIACATCLGCYNPQSTCQGTTRHRSEISGPAYLTPAWSIGMVQAVTRVSLSSYFRALFLTRNPTEENPHYSRWCEASSRSLWRHASSPYQYFSFRALCQQAKTKLDSRPTI